MPKHPKVCIIGAESWGSAISTAVCRNVLDGDFDSRVHIYVYDELVRSSYLSEVINERHENIKYLPGIKLSPNLVAVNDLIEAAKHADIIIFATPYNFVRPYCNILAGKVKKTAYAVSLTKGLDHIKDGEIDLYSHTISNQLEIPCYTIMNGSSAMEMAQGKLCEITIGCNNDQHAGELTTLFQTDNCKVVNITDVDGVELCNTLKDLVALSAGLIDGLRLGDNARVTCLHLGLKEMMRFIKSFNPTTKLSTFFESCGVAHSVASSYGDKNVTFAKNFVTSRKTVEEIEANLLNGRKLLGPLIAAEIFAFLEKENLLHEYPLFTVVHRICQHQLPPDSIIDTLRNHPDLTNFSISQLQREEYALGSEMDSILENVADTIPEVTVGKGKDLKGLDRYEDEVYPFWKPYFQYLTVPNDAKNEPVYIEKKSAAAIIDDIKIDRNNLEFSFEVGSSNVKSDGLLKDAISTPVMASSDKGVFPGDIQLPATGTPNLDTHPHGVFNNNNSTDWSADSPLDQSIAGNENTPIAMSKSRNDKSPITRQADKFGLTGLVDRHVKPFNERYKALKLRVKAKNQKLFTKSAQDKSAKENRDPRKKVSAVEPKGAKLDSKFVLHQFDEEPDVSKLLEMIRARELEALEREAALEIVPPPRNEFELLQQQKRIDQMNSDSINQSFNKEPINENASQPTNEKLKTIDQNKKENINRKSGYTITLKRSNKTIADSEPELKNHYVKFDSEKDFVPLQYSITDNFYRPVEPKQKKLEIQPIKAQTDAQQSSSTSNFKSSVPLSFPELSRPVLSENEAAKRIAQTEEAVAQLSTMDNSSCPDQTKQTNFGMPPMKTPINEEHAPSTTELNPTVPLQCHQNNNQEQIVQMATDEKPELTLRSSDGNKDFKAIEGTQMGIYQSDLNDIEKAFDNDFKNSIKVVQQDEWQSELNEATESLSKVVDNVLRSQEKELVRLIMEAQMEIDKDVSDTVCLAKEQEPIETPDKDDKLGQSEFGQTLPPEITFPALKEYNAFYNPQYVKEVIGEDVRLEENQPIVYEYSKKGNDLTSQCCDNNSTLNNNQDNFKEVVQAAKLTEVDGATKTEPPGVEDATVQAFEGKCGYGPEWNWLNENEAVDGFGILTKGMGKRGKSTEENQEKLNPSISDKDHSIISQNIPQAQPSNSADKPELTEKPKVDLASSSTETDKELKEPKMTDEFPEELYNEKRPVESSAQTETKPKQSAYQVLKSNLNLDKPTELMLEEFLKDLQTNRALLLEEFSAKSSPMSKTETKVEKPSEMLVQDEARKKPSQSTTETNTEKLSESSFRELPNSELANQSSTILGTKSNFEKPRDLLARHIINEEQPNQLSPQPIVQEIPSESPVQQLPSNESINKSSTVIKAESQNEKPTEYLGKDLLSKDNVNRTSLQGTTETKNEKSLESFLQELPKSESPKPNSSKLDTPSNNQNPAESLLQDIVIPKKTTPQSPTEMKPEEPLQEVPTNISPNPKIEAKLEIPTELMLEDFLAEEKFLANKAKNEITAKSLQREVAKDETPKYEATSKSLQHEVAKDETQKYEAQNQSMVQDELPSDESAKQSAPQLKAEYKSENAEEFLPQEFAKDESQSQSSQFNETKYETPLLQDQLAKDESPTNSLQPESPSKYERTKQFLLRELLRIENSQQFEKPSETSFREEMRYNESPKPSSPQIDSKEPTEMLVQEIIKGEPANQSPKHLLREDQGTGSESITKSLSVNETPDSKNQQSEIKSKYGKPKDYLLADFDFPKKSSSIKLESKNEEDVEMTNNETLVLSPSILKSDSKFERPSKIKSKEEFIIDQEESEIKHRKPGKSLLDEGKDQNEKKIQFAARHKKYDLASKLLQLEESLAKTENYSGYSQFKKKVKQPQSFLQEEYPDREIPKEYLPKEENLAKNIDPSLSKPKYLTEKELINDEFPDVRTYKPTDRDEKKPDEPHEKPKSKMSHESAPKEKDIKRSNLEHTDRPKEEVHKENKFRRNNGQLNQMTQKLSNLMKEDQSRAWTSKERKVKYSGKDPYIKNANILPKLSRQQTYKTIHERDTKRNRLVVKPNFPPPINPRIRVPRPPFDVRDHEYHTVNYRPPPDLIRNKTLPKGQMSTTFQANRMASKNVAKLPRPVLKLPSSIMRSSVLAVELGIFAVLLSRYRGGCK